MNDKRIKNYFNLLSCRYVSTDLKPYNQDADGLRYMDAKYLAEKLHFKPRMIYKLTQQLLDNKEITQVSKSYNGKGFNQKANSKLYQLDEDIIENYLLLIKMKCRNRTPDYVAFFTGQKSIHYSLPTACFFDLFDLAVFSSRFLDSG